MELGGLRATREEAFLTQQELADRAGLTKASVNRLEQGKQRARISTVRRLAAALGVEPAALVGERSPGPVTRPAGHSGLATGGRQGSPVHGLMPGTPGQTDAVWARSDGGAEHGTDDEEERR